MVINKKILTELYYNKKLTLREIALNFNVTHVCILDWMKRFNIKRRSHSTSQIGRIHSIKTRKLMSLSKKGKPSIFKGMTNRYSEETLKKMRIVNKKNARNGNKHHNWHGGISKIGYPYYFNEELKEKIRERDNHTCQNCNILEKEHLIVFNRALIIHHIDYNKENCKENNLISLCQGCNIRANYNRNYWKRFYQSKIIGE
jgi:predicted DNA-binding protein YlxM (UPF0122 family)